MVRIFYSDKVKGLSLGCLATICWASFYVISRMVYGVSSEPINPLLMTFIRFFFASIFFVAAVAYRKEGAVIKRAFIKDYKTFILLAISGIFLQGVLVFYSLNFTTATRSSLFANTAPIFTVIISCVFLKEYLGKNKLIGMFIGFAGLLITVLGGSGGDMFSENASIYGDVLALLSGICWAVYTVAGVKVSQAYGGFVSATVSIIIGTAILFAFLVGGGVQLNFSMPLKIWLLLAYLGICGNGLAFVFWLATLKYLTPGELGSLGYITPAFTTLLAIIFLAERVGLVFWLGLALVLIGTSLMTKRQTRQLKLPIENRNCIKLDVSL